MPDYDLIDPRPDLTEDHRLWVVLLEEALRHPNPKRRDAPYWILQGLRCLGAHLEMVNGRLKMSGGEDEAEYERHRAEYLAPRTALFTTILTDASRRLAQEETNAQGSHTATS